MLKILLFVTYLGTSLSGLYLLKAAPVGMNAAYVAGGLAYAGGAALWLAVLRAYPLSLAFPLASGALMAGTQLIGILLLDEKATPVRLIGIALILAGIAALVITEPGAARE